jgi:hypothetical protein
MLQLDTIGSVSEVIRHCINCEDTINIFRLLQYFRRKMEASFSSETLIKTCRTARHRISEDRNFHNHQLENLKSCEEIRICRQAVT